MQKDLGFRNKLIQQIKEHEEKSSELDPSPATREQIARQVFYYAEDFLNTLEDSEIYNPNDGKGLYDFPITNDGEDLSKVLKVLKDEVDTSGLNPASGGYIGYIPGGGIYYSALGDYLADITNRYSGIYFLGPGAVKMENVLLKWIIDLVGFPKTSAGSLTSGGTAATLTALIAAREAFKLKSCDFAKTVIYLTQQTHHCLTKTLKIIGMSEAIIRNVPTDQHFRMNPLALQGMIEEDLQSGLRPWLIAASAGTTDFGSVDPLTTLSILAKNYKLWFHVDAAYGGFFLLTKVGKRTMAGISSADSIILDPHKSLFIPYGLGVVLIRNKRNLIQAYSYDEASYLKDTERDGEISPHHSSLELTRHFRAPRLWLPLKLIGVKPFSAALEEKLLLAKYFYESIKEIKNMELACEPQLSIVVFRYVPKHGDANEFNLNLLKGLRASRRVFLSSTILNKKIYLRFACLHFRTHLKLVDHVLMLLRENIQQLKADQIFSKI